MQANGSLPNGSFQRMEFDATDAGFGNGIPRQASKGVIPRFFHSPVVNQRKSAEAGHPVYDTLEMIEILIPGDSKTVVQRRATRQDREMFDGAYHAFKQGVEFQGDGLPLANWPGISVGQVQTLHGMKVYTVEHLAGLRDSTISANNAIGMRELREKARAYLEHAKGLAPIAKIIHENEALKAQAAESASRMDALERKLAELTSRQGDQAPMVNPNPPVQKPVDGKK